MDLNGIFFICVDEAIKRMDAQGYRPANLYELLALGAQHEDFPEQFWIVALGSSWVRPSGGRIVPYLDGDGSGRSLRLFWAGDDWGGDWRFAAVRK